MVVLTKNALFHDHPLDGQVLADDGRRRITEAWGVEPFQVYGSTEALVLASESPERVGLHISEDLVVLEVEIAREPGGAKPTLVESV